MFRRLATLALSLSLLASASPAVAGGFAVAPADPPAAPSYPISHEVLPAPSSLLLAEQAKVRATLARRRAANLRAFRAYVRRGRYPHNYQTKASLNVWRDRDGRLCAAATMIFRSGQRSLVNRVARTDNFIRLADVTSGPLHDWILTSGLTHAEVIAIQEPFMGNDEPGRSPREWQASEDDRLRARYAQVLAMLDANRDASLDAALAAVEGRRDLLAKLR